MRVSVGIHGEDIDGAIETYNLLSEKYFTHASPTLFNAATPRPQLSRYIFNLRNTEIFTNKFSLYFFHSCFLVAMKEDSLKGIFDTVTSCAIISKSAGGIGLHVHCIRATDSYIEGTNGVSNGLVPMLGVFNNLVRYVDQGGNKVNIIFVPLFVLHI